MRTKPIQHVLLVAMMLWTTAGWAQDSAYIAQKAEFCERCHGEKGFTDNPNMPKLAGQNKGYLIKQLNNFRRGLRKSTPMHQVTLTLSDEDIENLASYFNSISISLNEPEVAE